MSPRSRPASARISTSSATTTTRRTAPACATTSMSWTWPRRMRWRSNISARTTSRSPSISAPASAFPCWTWSAPSSARPAATSRSTSRRAAPGDVASYYANPAAAERIFGWKAKLNVDDMCRDSWRWQAARAGDQRCLSQESGSFLKKRTKKLLFFWPCAWQRRHPTHPSLRAQRSNQPRSPVR